MTNWQIQEKWGEMAGGIGQIPPASSVFSSSPPIFPPSPHPIPSIFPLSSFFTVLHTTALAGGGEHPCTAISHNRNSGRRGNQVSPQGGRPGDRNPSGPAGPLRSYVQCGQPWGPCSAKSLSAWAQGTQHPVGHHWAPEVFCGDTSARRGSGTQGANPWAPVAQRRYLSALRGSSTQWATAGAPEAPCGKEWWARHGKEPPMEEQGTWASRARKRNEADCGRPEDGGVWTAKQSNDPCDTQHNPNTPTTGRHWRTNGTAYHIQHSPSTPTTGLHERGNDTSGSTGRSGQQKAATRRNMRREERVTVQGPTKKQLPDGKSHRGGGQGPQGKPVCTSRITALFSGQFRHVWYKISLDRPSGRLTLFHKAVYQFTRRHMTVALCFFHLTASDVSRKKFVTKI